MIDLPSTLDYDLTKEDPQNIPIDYRNANYKTISISLSITSSPITLKQDFRLGKGGILWDGSFFITKYLIDVVYPTEPSPSFKWMLELGAGTALPSISALIKGYNTVITDIPKLILFCQEIVVLNKALYAPSAEYRVQQLSWENKGDIPDVKKVRETFDIIIGCELVYLDDLFDALIDTLINFSNEKTLILMCYKVRLQSMVDDFMLKVQKGFTVEFIEYEYKNSLYPLPEKLKMIKLVKKQA